VEPELTDHVEALTKLLENWGDALRKGHEMGIPQERLPEREDEILAPGARLQVTLNRSQEVEIVGNQRGLQALASICSGLAELTPEQLLTPANHYHLDEDFWGTEKGSVPLIIYCHEDGWQGWLNPSERSFKPQGKPTQGHL
jgi:hypothetical protein